MDRSRRAVRGLFWSLGVSLGLALALCASGCGEKPAPITDPQAEARAARDAAQAACEARDPAAAEKAAQRAEAAAEAAKAALPKDAATTPAPTASPTPGSPAALAARSREVAALAREARRFAELAANEAARAGALDAWRACAYRKARAPAMAVFFNGLARAVEAQAAPAAAPSASPGGTPGAFAQGLQEAAELGLLMVDFFGRPPATPDGRPDPAAVAAELRRMAEAPPAELGGALAAGYFLGGRGRLALYEIELAGLPAEIPAERRACLRIVRGMVYRNQGWNALAAREFEALVEELPAAEGGGGSGPELEAGLRLLLAAYYFSERDYRQADLEAMRALQAWPNNPVSVILTGERQAADGSYEQAEQTLASAARDSDEAWLAERIRARARRIRDKRGEAEPLFYDQEFVRDLAVFFIRRAARQSQAAERLRGALDAARRLAGELGGKLGGGTGEPDVSAASATPTTKHQHAP